MSVFHRGAVRLHIGGGERPQQQVGNVGRGDDDPLALLNRKRALASILQSALNDAESGGGVPQQQAGMADEADSLSRRLQLARTVISGIVGPKGRVGGVGTHMVGPMMRGSGMRAHSSTPSTDCSCEECCGDSCSSTSSSLCSCSCCNNCNNNSVGGDLSSCSVCRREQRRHFTINNSRLSTANTPSRRSNQHQQYNHDAEEPAYSPATDSIEYPATDRSGLNDPPSSLLSYDHHLSAMRGGGRKESGAASKKGHFPVPSSPQADFLYSQVLSPPTDSHHRSSSSANTEESSYIRRRTMRSGLDFSLDDNNQFGQPFHTTNTAISDNKAVVVGSGGLGDTSVFLPTGHVAARAYVDDLNISTGGFVPEFREEEEGSAVRHAPSATSADLVIERLLRDTSLGIAAPTTTNTTAAALGPAGGEAASFNTTLLTDILSQLNTLVATQSRQSTSIENTYPVSSAAPSPSCYAITQTSAPVQLQIDTEAELVSTEVQTDNRLEDVGCDRGVLPLCPSSTHHHQLLKTTEREADQVYFQLQHEEEVQLLLGIVIPFLAEYPHAFSPRAYYGHSANPSTTAIEEDVQKESTVAQHPVGRGEGVVVPTVTIRPPSERDTANASKVGRYGPVVEGGGSSSSLSSSFSNRNQATSTDIQLNEARRACEFLQCDGTTDTIDDVGQGGGGGGGGRTVLDGIGQGDNIFAVSILPLLEEWFKANNNADEMVPHSHRPATIFHLLSTLQTTTSQQLPLLLPLADQLSHLSSWATSTRSWSAKQAQQQGHQRRQSFDELLEAIRSALTEGIDKLLAAPSPPGQPEQGSHSSKALVVNNGTPSSNLPPSSQDPSQILQLQLQQSYFRSVCSHLADETDNRYMLSEQERDARMGILVEFHKAMGAIGESSFAIHQLRKHEDDEVVRSRLQDKVAYMESQLESCKSDMIRLREELTASQVQCAGLHARLRKVLLMPNTQATTTTTTTPAPSLPRTNEDSSLPIHERFARAHHQAHTSIIPQYQVQK